MTGRLRRAIRRTRIRLERRWDRLRAPWPIVGECFMSGAWHGHACEQCTPTHRHQWTSWPAAPSWVGSPGVPIRCIHCGARKCDRPLCNFRRHDGHGHG